MPNFFRVILIIFCFYPLTTVAFGLDLKPYYYFFDYEEFDTAGRSLNNETGRIPGMSVSWTQQPISVMKTRFGFNYASSTVNYSGFTQRGRSHSTKTEQRFLSLNAAISYPFDIHNIQISPLLEFQKRAWSRAILANNNVSSLTERYRWNEWAVGAELKYPVMHGGITFVAKRLYTRSGKIKIDLASLKPNRPVLNLGSDTGYELGLGYQFSLSGRQTWSINAFYKEWCFSRGNTAIVNTNRGVFAVTEPRSKTKVNGVSIEYAHQF